MMYPLLVFTVAVGVCVQVIRSQTPSSTSSRVEVSASLHTLGNRAHAAPEKQHLTTIADSDLRHRKPVFIKKIHKSSSSGIIMKRGSSAKFGRTIPETFINGDNKTKYSLKLNYSTEFNNTSGKKYYVMKQYNKYERNSKLPEENGRNYRNNGMLILQREQSLSAVNLTNNGLGMHNTKYDRNQSKPQEFTIHTRPDHHSWRLRREFDLSGLDFSFSSGSDFDRKRPCFSRQNSLVQACSCYSTACDCSNTDIVSIPQDLPANITELTIAFTTIQNIPPDAFLRYRSLRSLDLSCNKLQLLDTDSFNGLALLSYLDLSNNFIGFTPEQLPEQVFEPLKSLKLLRLNGNGDGNNKRYPDQSLASLTSLEELHVDGESGANLGPGFRNMTSLHTLSFSSAYCNIFSLSNGAFINVGQITFLNLSNCNLISKYIEKGALSLLKNLAVLDISRNPNLGFEGVERLLWGLSNSSLHTLRIDSIVYGNTLNYLTASTFDHMPQSLQTIVARWNGVLHIDIHFMKKLPKRLKTLDLRDTTIITNVSHVSFAHLLDLETILLNNQECPTEYTGTRIAFFSESGLDSNIKLSDSDSKLSNSHSKLSDSHPKLTNSYLDFPKSHSRLLSHKTWTSPTALKRVGINVQSLKLEIVYIALGFLKIESNIEELDLCCGYLPEFSFSLLQSFTKIQKLSVRGTSISKLIAPTDSMNSVKVFRLQSNFLDVYLKNTHKPLSFMPNLKYVDLSLNHLSFLREDLFQGLDHLEYLYLDQNLFSQFYVDIFSMTSLKLLNLSNTALFQLPMKVRSFVNQLHTTNPGQVRIDMSGCPIQCDCYNLDFLNWMISSGAFDSKFNGYKCKNVDTSIQDIFDGYKDTITRLEKECADNYPMFLLVLSATMMLVFAMLGTVMYRLRWELRYLYYAAYLKFTSKNKPGKGKQFEYDVFISYDAQDGLFVISLNHELEKRGFKLLIHSRDFVAGDFIASNIVKAVSKSRKTLVVLTRKLLASTWCNYEIQMATMESVQTGRQVLVFLLKENIPNKELGVELLRYIRRNTYLPYPSQEDEGDDVIMNRFYEKLAHDLRC